MDPHASAGSRAVLGTGDVLPSSSVRLAVRAARPDPRGAYFVGSTFAGTPALTEAHGVLDDQRAAREGART